jgi:hypothetical protein
MVRVGLDEGADQGIASEPGLFLIALSDIAYAAAQAATKKRAASAPWGTIVIFGRAFRLRVGGRSAQVDAPTFSTSKRPACKRPALDQGAAIAPKIRSSLRKRRFS